MAMISSFGSRRKLTSSCFRFSGAYPCTPGSLTSRTSAVGSDAVNVFLGLGLPWMIGALYWSRKGATPEWAARYPDQAALYPQGGFVVPAGDLGYSVTVFCVCAVTCLGTLTLRRSVLGGELGGPSWAAASSGGPLQLLLQKRVVAALFVLLWGVYIVASVLKSSSHAGV